MSNLKQSVVRVQFALPALNVSFLLLNTGKKENIPPLHTEQYFLHFFLLLLCFLAVEHL